MPEEKLLNGRKHTAIADRMVLRSEKVQELLSRRPGFLTTLALPVFLLILVSLIGASWLIQYPDIINAKASLTATNAPKELVIRQQGKLLRLFVRNDDTVTQDQPIAWIESTASHEEVIRLSALLDKATTLLAHDQTARVSALFVSPLQHLGELQSAYQQFITAWQQFNDYLVNGYYSRRAATLQQDLSYLTKMHATLAQQKQFTQQDLDLTREAVEVNDSLYKDKVISKQDLRDQQSKLLGKQLGMPSLESAVLSNENAQIDKSRDIDEVEHNISQQKIIFEQALHTLKSAVDDWDTKYILRAPVTGKIVFAVPLQENQFMQPAKTIGYVNPSDSRFYAQVMLSQNNFGKIRVGQKVLLRFDAYPYQEFGAVPGELTYVSNVPVDSGFLANIALPQGLVTTYRRQLQYRSGLTAQALIITRDARMLQRFYYTMVKASKE